MTLKEFINKIYMLDYRSNTFADKKHEESIKQILIENGFTQIDKNCDKSQILKNKSNLLKTIDDLKSNFIFIEQPFGSQKSPDFIVCIDGFILWIECKSGKNKITWNTGFPKTNVLFLFSCKSKNTTTLFFGQHSDLIINNPNFEKDYVEFDKALKKLSSDNFGNTFKTKNYTFYMRKMLNDKTKYSDEKVRSSFYEQTLLTLNIKG